MDWDTETMQVLAAINAQESPHEILGIRALIETTGLEPMTVANEVERLIREGLVSGELHRTLSGGDPSPWFLVGPLVTHSGKAVLGLRGTSVEQVSQQHDLGDAGDARKASVFVVHGRNIEAKEAIFTFLRALGLHAVGFDDARAATGKPTPYIGDVLVAGFKVAAAALVLFTPDDDARLRPRYVATESSDEGLLLPQARQNVVYEAGMAMALDETRTVFVVMGAPRLPSDIHGRHYVQMDGSRAARSALRDRLRDAGCAVDDSSDEWLTAGSFDIEGLSEVGPPAPRQVDDTKLLLSILEEELAANEAALMTAAESAERYGSPDELGVSRAIYDTYALDLGRVVPPEQHRVIRLAYQSTFPAPKLMEMRGATVTETGQPIPMYYIARRDLCRKAQMEVTAALSAVRQLLASS